MRCSSATDRRPVDFGPLSGDDPLRRQQASRASWRRRIWSPRARRVASSCTSSIRSHGADRAPLGQQVRRAATRALLDLRSRRRQQPQSRGLECPSPSTSTRSISPRAPDQVWSAIAELGLDSPLLPRNLVRRAHRSSRAAVPHGYCRWRAPPVDGVIEELRRPGRAGRDDWSRRGTCSMTLPYRQSRLAGWNGPSRRRGTA